MIELKEFTFRYRESVEPVVRDVNLTIPDGTFVGITGAAGSGKSTVAKKVAGMLGFHYLDTGAMYRTIALYMLKKEVDIDDV